MSVSHTIGVFFVAVVVDDDLQLTAPGGGTAAADIRSFRTNNSQSCAFLCRFRFLNCETLVI